MNLPHVDYIDVQCKSEQFRSVRQVKGPSVTCIGILDGLLHKVSCLVTDPY